MKTLQSSLIRAIVAIIVGTLIIKYREETVRWLTIACGTLFFISGLISCAVYYSNRKSVKEQLNAEGKSITPATSAGLPLVGAGSIILGAILAFMPSTFVTGLMYTLAAILILGAVNQYINLGMASRWYHVGWFYWLLPTIILLIALFVIFKPFEVAAAPLFILGWCMLLYGVAECLSGIKAHKAERQKRIQEEAAVNTSDTSSQIEQIEEAEAEEVVSEETTPSTPPQQP